MNPWGAQRHHDAAKLSNNGSQDKLEYRYAVCKNSNCKCRLKAWLHSATSAVYVFSSKEACAAKTEVDDKAEKQKRQADFYAGMTKTRMLTEMGMAKAAAGTACWASVYSY